jgi:hypothetical protein
MCKIENMKKIQLILLLLMMTGMVLKAQQSGNTNLLKPTGFQKRVTTIVSGKPRYYYSLSPDKPSVIHIAGPGKLKVLSRARFKTESPAQLKYTISYSVDGSKTEVFTVTDAVKSSSDTYLDGTLGIPAQSKEFEIELSRGDHTVEFKLGDANTMVAARYIFTPSKEKKQEWVAFSPLRPSEPVNIISKENTAIYYRFSKEKPLKVEVNGPTQLRVLTRIENHYQMRGRIHYRIQVKENGLVINTYQHSSDRSEVTFYEDNKELVPGKACEFVIEVPKGKHAYEIVLMEEDNSTVLGRLLLPKKDVKLIE